MPRREARHIRFYLDTKCVASANTILKNGLFFDLHCVRSYQPQNISLTSKRQFVVLETSTYYGGCEIPASFPPGCKRWLRPSRAQNSQCAQCCICGTVFFDPLRRVDLRVTTGALDRVLLHAQCGSVRERHRILRLD